MWFVKTHLEDDMLEGVHLLIQRFDLFFFTWKAYLEVLIDRILTDIVYFTVLDVYRFRFLLYCRKKIKSEIKHASAELQ